MAYLEHAGNRFGCGDIFFFGLLVFISILTAGLKSNRLQLLITIILILIVSAITT